MPLNSQGKSNFAVTCSLALLLGSGTGAHAGTAKEHHFDQPYQCDRSREVTSSSTGEIRTVYYRAIYFPKMDWRIALTDV